MEMKRDGYVWDTLRRILSEEDYRELDEKYCDFVNPENAERSRNAIQAIKDELAKKDFEKLNTFSDGTGGKVRESIQATSGVDLMKKDIPPTQFCISALLPEGLTVLAAPPKSYKSYMALAMCIEIASGGMFLGRPCFKHTCLYFDLESTERRPQTRLKQILRGRPMPEGFWLIDGTHKVGMIGKGFEDTLEDQIKQHPDIGFIVVDVFQKVKPAGKRTMNAYESDYEIMGRLQNFAVSHNVALLLIHHTNKGRQVDTFDKISGSTGIMGSADCVMMIDKDDRYSDDATLCITGRDLEPQRLRIHWNKDIFQWEYLGSAEDIEEAEAVFAYENSSVIQTIKKLLSQFGGHWEGTVSEIIEASKYYQTYVSETASQVGKIIGAFQVRLSLEGITVEKDKRGKGRQRMYVFDMSATSSVSAPSAPSAPSASA